MRILYLPSYKAQQRQFEKKNYNPYPVRLASEAEWYRKQGHQVFWAKDYPVQVVNTQGGISTLTLQNMDKIIREPENLPFLTLPRPDRVFTKAKEYTSGNYKYLPGTHILSAWGCSWHNCTFCVENGISQEVRPVEDVIQEIEECKALGFKEVFDDSASFPMEFILATDFLQKLRRVGIRFSCNLRITPNVPFDVLRSSGFRMCLFGIESANQITLDKINKGVKVEEIIPTLKKATACGIEPHIAVMFGYPDETDDDAIRTLKLVHFLLRKGYAKTAQASLYSPQGVPGNEAHKKYIRKIYDVGFDPRFWFTKLKSINDVEDIKYIWRGIKSWLVSLS